jgi:mycofactocin precursor
MPETVEPTTAPGAAPAAPLENDLPEDSLVQDDLLEESLVEEVSIDGMCGVY